MGSFHDGWDWLRRLLRERGLSEEEQERKVCEQRAWVRQFMGERELFMEKAQTLGFGFVDLDRVEANREAMQAAPAELLRYHQIAPVMRDGACLYVAMAEPESSTAIDAIQSATGCRIVPVVSTPKAIADWIDRHYPV